MNRIILLVKLRSQQMILFNIIEINSLSLYNGIEISDIIAYYSTLMDFELQKEDINT